MSWNRCFALCGFALALVLGSFGAIASTPKEDRRHDDLFVAKFYDGMRLDTTATRKTTALILEAPAPDPCTNGTIVVPQHEMKIRWIPVACPKKGKPQKERSISDQLLEGAAKGTILNFIDPKSFNRHLFPSGPLCMGTGCPMPGAPPQ